MDLAYIAGFLDGDGSLMLQLKKRSDTSRGVRFMLTICFYQDTRHEAPLLWIREILGAGYVSRRKDGMTELRIQGFDIVSSILDQLLPFLRFKRIQAQALLRASLILKSTKLSDDDLRELVDCMIAVQTENYSAHTKRSREELLAIVGLTP